ncbi:hypothetical protein [Listeria rocourtiae]|nr:hypothetical protein [Listeria rocourtiae]
MLNMATETLEKEKRTATKQGVDVLFTDSKHSTFGATIIVGQC